MSRQSDSNRRPADYKSAALNQLSYAGVSPYESRFLQVHQEFVMTPLSRTREGRLFTVVFLRCGSSSCKTAQFSETWRE
jgi:hypothetical protein